MDCISSPPWLMYYKTLFTYTNECLKSRFFSCSVKFGGTILIDSSVVRGRHARYIYLRMESREVTVYIVVFPCVGLSTAYCTQCKINNEYIRPRFPPYSSTKWLVLKPISVQKFRDQTGFWLVSVCYYISIVSSTKSSGYFIGQLIRADIPLTYIHPGLVTAITVPFTAYITG